MTFIRTVVALVLFIILGGESLAAQTEPTHTGSSFKDALPWLLAGLLTPLLAFWFIWQRNRNFWKRLHDERRSYWLTLTNRCEADLARLQNERFLFLGATPGRTSVLFAGKTAERAMSTHESIDQLLVVFGTMQLALERAEKLVQSSRFLWIRTEPFIQAFKLLVAKCELKPEALDGALLRGVAITFWTPLEKFKPLSARLLDAAATLESQIQESFGFLEQLRSSRLVVENETQSLTKNLAVGFELLAELRAKHGLNLTENEARLAAFAIELEGIISRAYRDPIGECCAMRTRLLWIESELQALRTVKKSLDEVEVALQMVREKLEQSGRQSSWVSRWQCAYRSYRDVPTGDELNAITKFLEELASRAKEILRLVKTREWHGSDLKRFQAEAEALRERIAMRLGKPLEKIDDPAFDWSLSENAAQLLATADIFLDAGKNGAASIMLEAWGLIIEAKSDCTQMLSLEESFESKVLAAEAEAGRLEGMRLRALVLLKSLEERFTPESLEIRREDATVSIKENPSAISRARARRDELLKQARKAFDIGHSLTAGKLFWDAEKENRVIASLIAEIEDTAARLEETKAQWKRFYETYSNTLRERERRMAEPRTSQSTRCLYDTIVKRHEQLGDSLTHSPFNATATFRQLCAVKDGLARIEESLRSDRIFSHLALHAIEAADTVFADLQADIGGLPEEDFDKAFENSKRLRLRIRKMREDYKIPHQEWDVLFSNAVRVIIAAEKQRDHLLDLGGLATGALKALWDAIDAVKRVNSWPPSWGVRVPELRGEVWLEEATARIAANDYEEAEARALAASEQALAAIREANRIVEARRLQFRQAQRAARNPAWQQTFKSGLFLPSHT